MFVVLSIVLGMLAGIASLAFLAGAVYVGWEWVTGVQIAIGWLLFAAVGLLWSALGRLFVLLLYRRGSEDPEAWPGNRAEIAGPAGSKLNIVMDGPANAPALVLTHGWGFDHTAWSYLRKRLHGKFRLVLWDLPGLGASEQFDDGILTIDRFAESLRMVVEYAGGPVTLVGHSIGGMTMLTFCRRYPELLGTGGVVWATDVVTPTRLSPISEAEIRVADRRCISSSRFWPATSLVAAHHVADTKPNVSFKVLAAHSARSEDP